MPASRPDYAEWVARHGLRSGTADDLSLLVRTDGHRATDRVELLARPARQDGRPVWTSWFFVRGVSPEREAIIARLAPNERLRISLRDAEDLRTGLRTEDQALVGYVPNFVVFKLQDVVRDSCLPDVFVERVNGPPVPHYHRLLCRMEVLPENEGSLFGDERFKPVGNVGATGRR